ncbi:MAG: hypothetical protein HC802_13385, partial [Caldilineaceae bacterium]|nr:hypothetical protein [Caldilineaceae bacterium]
MADLLLAADIGSTTCKAAYLDAQGRIIAVGRASTRQIPAARVGTLEGFWQAFVAAAREAGDRLPFAPRPVAIGIACRALFGACLDETGSAYWPIWDKSYFRTSPEIRAAYSAEVWGEKNPFNYGYATTFGGLVNWLQHHGRRLARHLAYRRAPRLCDLPLDGRMVD